MRAPEPMRCDDVTRALAAPSAGDDLTALAAHLAACPPCSAWADRDAALSRLWEVTRPVEPTADAWDALWARVSEGLDRAAEPSVVPLPLPSRWRPSLVAGLLAQAAAVLALFAWSARHDPTAGPKLGPRGEAPITVAVARAEVDIDPGEVVLIREDARGLHAVELASDDRPNTLDGNYAMFNDVEAMAE